MHESRPYERSPAVNDVERPGDGLGATLVTTGMAWLVVYLLLLTLFSIFEDQLAALTLPVRLLVVSDVLVTLMANLVIPIVMRIVGDWIGRRSIPVADAGRCQRRPPPGAVMGWIGRYTCPGTMLTGSDPDGNRC
jgi:hypothetical protein